MKYVHQAVVYTLGLHALVLAILVVWPATHSESASEQYAEVLFAEDELLSAPEISYEAQLKLALDQRIANLRANAESATSSEARSSSDEGPSEAELAAQVEAELRAMEAAEFERLGAEQKEFETAGEADVTRQEVGQTYEKWDAQYDGLVTVRYSLPGRSGRDLDVPGYTCVGGAQIEVAIEVAADGRVVEARLVQGDPESCFGAAALRSARRARFNASSDAPKRQKGRLTYVFVAQ